MEIERRDFLKVGMLTAGALAGGRLWGNVGSEVVNEPIWEGPPGEERDVFSVCQMCPNGCGIKVRIHEDRALKIEGLPEHPLNKGSLCPRGQAAIQLLYHPQRLKYPLINTGRKGKGNWQRLTFEEALGIIAEKLKALVRERSTHHLVMASGSFSDIDDFMIDRFCRSFGTPNYLKFESLGRQSMSMAMGLTHGIFSPPSIDWEHCEYLMLFGAEPGATDNSPMWLLNGFGQLRRGRAGRRTKIVHIATRYTPFSSKVDEWIKINPGTYGALALGMAHVIISEEKYNADFVDRFTLGFREIIEIDGFRRPGFKDHILRNYSLDRVSSITGVSEDTIIRLSEEFASAKPGVAYGGDGPASYSNAVTELVAIHCLNALVGSIDVPGGIMVQRTPPLKVPEDPAVPSLFANNLNQERVDGIKLAAGLPVNSATSGLPSRLSENSPYPVEALLIVDLDPVNDLPGSDNWRKALVSVPFVVSFANFIDESAKLADLIIPPGTFLERWDGKRVDSSTGFPVWGLSQPIFDTPLGGMDFSGFMLKLADKMGRRMAGKFPWNTNVELLKEMADGLQLSPGKSDPWDEPSARGFWSNGPYSFGHQADVYKARGNRFNFFMYSLAASASELFKSGFKGPGTTGDGLSPTDFLPNHIPPEFTESGPDYPFHLDITGTTVNGHGRFSFLDGLKEIQELGINRSWGRWLLIDHQTADRLHLKDNMKVWVESSRGKISALVKRFDGMRSDSVGLIFGQGKCYGKSSIQSNASLFSLLTEQISPIGGGYCWGGCKVRVYKA